MKDEQGESRGFGFVCFTNPDSAEAAVNAMNNKEVNGQTLYVGRAQRKEERQEILRYQYEKQRSERMSRGSNLYVKNLDDTINDVCLKEAFSKYGNITSAKVMLNESGNSKGFGFVCFTTSEEAKEAIKLNGTFMGSKPLYVSLAQCRKDRRARLMAEHQQILQNHHNAANIPSNVPNLPEQVPASTTQPFYSANVAMATPPQWNSGMAEPQFRLGSLRIGTASALRPNPAPAYVSGAASMVVGQSQSTSQSNLFNSQLHGQAGACHVMPNPMTSPVAGTSSGLVVERQYWVQRPSLPGLMFGANTSVPCQASAFVSANIRPGPISEPHVQQKLSAAAAGDNARSTKTPSRNTMTAQRQEVPTMTSSFHVGQTASAVAAHTTASTSAAQHEDCATGEAGKGGEGKCLTGVDRQAFGGKIYEKIAKGEPSLAGKRTGMIIQMDGSFVRKVADSSTELEQAVKGVKVALAKKKQNQVNSVDGQSSQKRN
ncbi:unnamed protein product [Hymenolepis diminuta]|nr:unnamed protein product [Hymenolepis diminuta]VUZ57052.1 unnamed protein product [Hymenolepis diminuta]